MTRLRFTHAAWLGALACAAFLAACSGSPAGAGPATSSCTVNEDCASGICESGACVPAGDVGEPLPDGDQPDVDTGGEEPDAIEDAGDTGTPDDTGAGTDATDAGPDVDEGTTGAPCTDNAACDSGYCISTSQGEVCTELCDGDCPFGWDCRLLTNSGGDVVSLCVPPQEVLCSPCTADIDCDGLQNACLQLSDGNFCGTACTPGDDACPSGYICQVERNGAGDETTQCVPELGVCGGCLDLDEDGYGVGALCLGLDCDDLDPTANPGALELCDFKDNDCDGTTDEDFDTTSDRRNCGVCGNLCTSVRATGMCVDSACEVDACEPGYYDINGDWLDGCEYACTPTVGAGEPDLCNRADDDCDGDIDEDVDFQADEANCGECGNVCDLAGADSECRAGACRIADCAAPLEDCNSLVEDGCETNLDTTLSSCGACGNACALANAIAVCTDGGCAIGTCNPGYDDCDDVDANGCEIQLVNNVSHCGACGTVCSFANAVPACNGTTCELAACNPGFLDCDGDPANGCEVDSRSDTNNCNGCGNECVASNGAAICRSSACVLSDCTEPFDDCDGRLDTGCESNTLVSLAHCGACGDFCSLANATEVCTAGDCEIQVCDANWGDCDGAGANGCETATVNNVNACGACGNVCSFANGVPACSGTTCTLNACSDGWTNCDENPANGCEVNTASSLANCGGCGAVCNLSNASETCVSGTCTFGTCAAGFADCNADLADGCEANLNTSTTHCNSCGNTCSLPNATPRCTPTGCAILSCNTGFEDCDGVAANGCEVNTQSSVNNCGGCGTVCSYTNGTPACAAGDCVLSACTGSFANCDSNAANGCEVNTASSLANCGSCGSVCNYANAAEVCSGGSCDFQFCSLGFVNCDGSLVNGCEVDVRTNINNCGSCGTLCVLPNANESCSGGNCNLNSCLSGFGNCDGNATNGCETNTTSTITACGACGTTCSVSNGTPACNSSTCAVATCNAGFGNCNDQYVDGCEVNLTNTVTSCGLCGTTCNLPNATESCIASTCAVAACEANFENCDGVAGNGCESSRLTDVNNCGSCGNVCSFANASATCSSGGCALGSCSAGWTNLDGNSANGCEYQCTFQSAVDVPNTSNPADPTNADDANCDGVDGVVLTSIFVSATSGNDANNGQTAAAAVATLDRAITLARASATRKTILVANGNYSGATLTLSFSDGISLYGGYSANFSDRTNTAASYAATSAATALSITSPAAVFTIDRVNFSTTNRSAGQSTIAVTVSNALAGVVTFRRLSITPGAGGAGSNGSAGSAGATGSTGNAGSGSTGGAGGAAPGGLPGGAGGNGRFANSGLSGANGAANTASGGAGGAGNGQNLGCGDGDPQTGSGGGPGTAPASAGTNGSNGGNVGSLASLVYTPSDGTPGFSGGIGGSGGGGGAGGGETCNIPIFGPDYRDTGRGGGGGGGGGGGAVGGSRGTGGGASIGLALIASNVALDNVTITAANGGQGGNGGAGGTGGTGGTGGAGALRTNNNHGSGGNGGGGGNGAAGGCGGGGGGGPSIAVWGASASTINLSGGSITAGTGGSGGTSGCGGSAPAGLTGATRDVTVTSRL